MRKITLHLPLVLLIFIGACSESDVFIDSDDTVQTDTLPDGTTGGTTGGTTSEFKGPDDYDLSLYLLHSNTQSVGGEVTFTENYYEKTSGNQLIFSRAIRHLNTGNSIDSISPDNSIFLQYVITINSIKEIGVSYDGAQGVLRYAELDEKYLDAVIENLGRRDTCTLQNHLDEFDLGNATGSATIASGVYEDVLHVFCTRVLDADNGGTGTSYSWNGYYAKSVGLIFANGNWVLLDVDANWFTVGDAYLIPEY